MYINEDGIDCFNAFVLRGDDWEESRVDCPSETRLSGSHGFDNDGDCLALDDGRGNDDNENGIPCDVQWLASNGVVTWIDADRLVDEDPDEQEYIGELGHRTFVIAVGKMAFVILLGLFIPLFLSSDWSGTRRKTEPCISSSRSRYTVPSSSSTDCPDT